MCKTFGGIAMKITKFGLKAVRSKAFQTKIKGLDIEAITVFRAIALCMNKNGETETSEQEITDFINDPKNRKYFPEFFSN